MTRHSRSLAQTARRLNVKKETALPALSTLAVLIGSLASAGAHANPSGGKVIAGSANIVDRGNGTLDINQSSGKAIINWKDFSIGANETVNFRQPGSNSVTLNRVVGNDPSAIFGRLNANGTVMLVNPNGVVFGKGARVDVGGLVATTANINDKDFLAGNYKFGQASPKAGAMIVNEGTISIKDSGLAALVAPSVRNSGVIEAKLGRVALAGAKTVTVDFQGDGLLSFDATSTVNELPKDANGKPVSALVANTGEIRADGGTVLMTARAVKGVIDNVVNTDGIVSAKTVGMQNGKIVLSGGDAGTVKLAGQIDATGTTAGERGGKVVVTGEHVDVVRGAALDVSGSAGGGEIALGSLGVSPDNGSAAFSGKSATVKVAAGATLKADALVQGDGGSVTMWSNEATAFAGSLSARGGAQGGDGGFAEVSSKKNIGLTGTADLRAPKGKTGLLLIDPTDLRIVNTSPGDQDGAASDGTINAADPNTANNTVSRGLLESLAGNANIKLEATGQITVADMAAINLKTTSGNSFTLRSTQAGGVRFENANTEISTQGGAITLEALGVGATLDNIGKLNSRGGAITLNATGDINLANVIDAGSGTALVRTSAGSIRNVGGANQVVIGNKVALDAGGGNIGAIGNMVNTQTAQLSLTTGGNLAVANRTVLNSLDITSRHAQPGVNNAYQLTSPGLTFNLIDDGSYKLNTVDQANLNFSFTGDRTITAGLLNVGAGALALTSTAGDILGGPGSLLSAGSLSLTAAGSNGKNGAIGSTVQALNTQIPLLAIASGSGGAYLNNTGDLNLRSVETTGPLTVASTGNLTLGAIKAGPSASLSSIFGNILDDGDNATTIATSSLTLSAAAGSIGTAARSLATGASSLSATSATGVYLDSTSSLTINQAQANNAAIAINSSGTLSANNVGSGGGAVSLSGTGVFAGQVNAGSGNVTLTARNGNITGNGASLITGSVVKLLAPVTGGYAIGQAGNALRTAAGEIQATGSSIFLYQAQGAALLQNIQAVNGITINGVSDLTANLVSTSANNGSIQLNAEGGSILRANANSVLSGSSISLQALADIGTATDRIKTSASSLTLNSGRHIYVDNPDKTLSSLSVYNRHAAGSSSPNVLEVSAPYLEFKVTDDVGVAYNLTKVYSSLLNNFSFSGDQDLKLGNIKGGNVVSLTSTKGSILDDGDINTRVTASNIFLNADKSIGASGNNVAINSGSLSASTYGDLYVTSVADLSSLTVTAKHKNATDVNQLHVYAPSLLFDIVDSQNGHSINQVRDANSVNFSFTSDRDLTVRSIDAGYGGSINLSSDGFIRDDGLKTTQLLANSVTLNAGKAIGASGNDHLDILTANLNATARDGGIFIQLPSPTGISNYNGVIALNNIYATDTVVIDARQGDLVLNNSVISTGANITLNAANGSIYNTSYGTVYAGGGNITIAAAGSIGGSYLGAGPRAINIGGVGTVTVTANAGTDLYLNANSGNDISLASLTAGGQIGYTQNSGTTTTGSVAASGAVSLSNDFGSILDDGNLLTYVRGGSIVLSAASGSLGAIGSALSLYAPDITLASAGDIAVNGLTNLNRLDITRYGSANAQYAITAPNLTAFTLTDDAAGTHLRSVASSGNLDFGFTSNGRNLLVGSIDAGAGGTVRLGSALSIGNDDAANPGSIRAAKVALTAGQGSSIGASGSKIMLDGATDLTLTAGNSFYVDSNAALNRLAITSSRAAGSSGTFDITALGQTYAIIDEGATHYLSQIAGAGLADFSFSSQKNIKAGGITASNSVSLGTTGGGINSSITSDASANRITANTVKLSATGSDNYTTRNDQTGSLGSSAQALRVSAYNLDIANNGDIYLNNGGLALNSLSLYLSRRDAGSATNFDTNAYAFGGMGSQALTITGGTTLGIAASMNGAALKINADSAITSNIINTGASGSVDLTSRYANTTLAPTIGGTGRITGGSISLTALGTNGSVTATTSTGDLAIASAGDVVVNNNQALNSLSLQAMHASSSGARSNLYSISAPNLTFSLTDSTGISGLTLNNISNPGNMALSLSSDRTLTIGLVQTGAGGSVALTTSGNIYGTSNSASAPDIITGSLTLNAGSAQGIYASNLPLYTSVDSLSSNIRGSLWLSNNKTLTLLNNTVSSLARVDVTNGSILQSGSGRFVSPVLTLTATQSIGAAGNAVLTDTRRLTTSTGKDLFLNNASDLFSLDITANHASGNPNVLQVAAQGLTFDVTDSLGYNLNQISDVTGLNFSFAGDTHLRIGDIDVGPAQTVSLYANGAGSNITNLAPTSHITGDAITLGANGSIGAASAGRSDSIHTNASEVYLQAGGNVYLTNDVDLATLSLYATNAGTPASYEIIADQLHFDVTNDGNRLSVNEVRDNTGLNLRLSSYIGQDIGIIDTQNYGTVTLTSNGSIRGSADSNQRITAAQADLTAQGNGGIGEAGREINLSAPIVRLKNYGDVYIDSDTHIDDLRIEARGNNARTYEIKSPTREGGTLGFDATDNGSGLVLNNVTDKGGLDLYIYSDRNITVGAIDVGYDDVTLYSNASLLGDGRSDTKVGAATLNLTAANGSIGAAGSGNAIDTRVSQLSANARNGGAYLTVEGNTYVPTLYSTGNSSVANTVGDIELGTVDTGGNAFTVDNQGGSILSGTINNTTTVNLTAAGSIGNKSAIRTNAYNGGTTTVTLNARAANGADGSIALTETYGLKVASVSAEGNVTLTGDTAGNGRDLQVGTITTTHGGVSLTSSRGNIVGIDNSNLITADSVTLSAAYGTSRSIGGSDLNLLHLNTPSLTLSTPGSIYVDNLADLTDLTINRTNAQDITAGSYGFLTIKAQNLVFSGGDNGGNTGTTLSTVQDSTGLNFTYNAVGAIKIGTIDVTQNGSVSLATNPYFYTNGSIQGLNASSKITAGDLKLSTATGNTPNAIGSSGLALNTVVKNINATASGGIWLNQTGTINLGNLKSGGDLSVTTTTGDILVGTVSYGSGNALTLNAQTGSILYGGGTISGSGGGAISLSARDGIGASDAAIRIAASNSPVSATVTGTGSLYLDNTGSLVGGLTTSVNNGETRVTSTGNIVLTSMISRTDAAGNDISVKSTGGSITVKNVQAGANHGQITLGADNGFIQADAAGATIKAYGVALNGSAGIGANSAAGRINASGQRVEATTNGTMYLAADANSVYSYLSGQNIDIAAAGNLQIANALSSGGSIKIVGNGANSQLVAGNIDAGAGSVNIDYSKAGSTIVDDREASTRIIGNTVTLKAGAGIGGATGSPDNLQTTAANITAEVTGAGSIYLDDNRAAGTTLSSIVTQNGAIGITTAGPTLVTSAVSKTSSANNNISIATSSGDLSVNTIDAKQLGNISLGAAGSINGAIPGNLIFGNSLTATAGGSIGSALNLADGSGGIALRTNLASLGNLSTAADGAVIVIDNVGTRTLTLNGTVDQTGEHSSTYIRSAGDLDARAGLANTADNLLLASGGTLTVASGGVQANGAVTLTGGNDIVAAGATPRTISVQADTLNFSSGAAGGSTTLTTQVDTANVNLSGTAATANLTLNNTGALTASLHAANGNITASATGTLNVSAAAGGNNRSIDLSSQQGDIAFGTIDAGLANGTIIMSAAQGSLLGAGTDLTANSLDLTSFNGIGAQNAGFMTSARNLKANVLGTGGIYVDGTGPLTLGRVATADGSIAITADGNLVSATGLSAGSGGNLTLASNTGNVTVNHAIADDEANKLSVSGAQISMAAASTAGSQTYTGNVTLNGDLSGSAIGITGNATLAGGKRTLTANGAGGDVSISGTLNGGAQQAVIVATDGNVTLGGNASNLASLNIDGANIDLRQVATTGAQQYNGATTLRGAYTTSNGAFGVDGATVLGSDVTVSTGSGAVTFTGGMTGANALTVTSSGATTYGGAVDIASLSQAGTGVTAINGGAVTTSGSQDYNGHVTLGGDTVLTGSSVALRNGADGTHALEIDGAAALAGAIGATTKLASLTVTGPATLNASGIATTGNQHYQGAVTLGSDQSLNTVTGSVAFDGALNGAHNLTVDSAAAGDISFGAIGGTARLGNLTANTSGSTTFNGAVRAASVQTDAPGSVAIKGGSIDTTGSQSYGELVTLTQDTTLKGSNILLGQGVNSADESQGLILDGNATINGPVGAGSNGRLASLTVTGTADLNGGVINTAGAQSYQGNVTLSDDLSINTANGNVAFGGTVASAAGAVNSLTVGAGNGDVTFAGAVGDAAGARLGDIAINSNGATKLDAAVYAASVTTNAGGTLALNGGLVDTTGAQSYGELAVLGADTVLKGSTVSLLGGGDGGHALAIAGNAVIGGELGATAPLTSLSVTGTADLGGGLINTAGAQSYQGNVTLSDDLSINTANGNVAFGGTVASAAGAGNSLTVGAGNGDVTFAGAVGDAAGARLGDIAINSDGATKLNAAVYAASVTTNAGGTLALNGGLVDTTGAQSYGELAVLGADALLKGSSVTLAQGANSVNEAQGLTIAGNAVVGGAIGAGSNARLASLTVTGAAQLGGGTIATVGAQSYLGDVTLSDGLTVNTNGAAGSNVTFGGKIASADGNQNSLTVNAGLGNVTLAGAIGDAAGARLGALAVNSDGATQLGGPVYAASVTTDAGGTLALNGGLVDTTGSQSYGELAVLGADTVLKGSNITLNQGADSADASQGLTIAGNAAVNGALGAGSRLAALAITGTADLNGGVINTTGAQSYQGNITLSDDLSINAANGNVAFGGAVASAAGAGNSLTVGAGNGDVTFAGAVGDAAGARLGDIIVNSNGATRLNAPVYAASVTTNAGGTLAINGGLVDTTGTQSYGELAVFGTDTVLKGSTVSLLGGGDGGHGLTVDGDAVLQGPFGANDALASLTVTGKSTLGTGSIATTGDQSYQGPVTLDGDLTVASLGGDIRFGDSVDGAHGLTVSASAGDVAFGGPVGQNSRLGDLKIDAAGDTVLDGPVRSASVQTSGGGDLLINGGSVDTTGSQQYGQHVILSGADTTLSGSDVYLRAGVDGTEPGQQGLLIAGNADIQGDVGGNTPLRGLTVEGSTTMGAGKVVTTGDQVYQGAVTLTGDRELTSNTGSIVLGSTLDGGNGNNLAITAGQDVRVAGDATGLGALTLRAVDTIVFNGDVSAYRVQQLEAASASYNGSVRASGPGGIDISGGNVSFGKNVTAETGAINIANTAAAGTTNFAAGTTVKAATGFVQTGGAGLTLPAQLLVTQGPIKLGAPAKLQGAAATISTNGDITAVGLSGPQTTLTLAAGPLGALRIGLSNADPSNKLDVADLIVPSAGSADVWGAIGGKSGALAAAMVKSSLVSSPYFLNGFTWGPTGAINRLTAVMAPNAIIPTTPNADPLFQGTVPPEGYGPNPLDAYTDPQVLKVASAGFAWQLPASTGNTQ